MPRSGVLGTATRIDPVPADHDALEGLGSRMDAGEGEFVLRGADGTEISLPPSMLRLVVSAARNLAAGHAVMVIAAEVTLTPAEAAELLALSRPFVAKLLERGDIPSEFLPGSRHRRVKLEDVLAFQERRQRRAEGRRRISDIADTASLPYLCLRSDVYLCGLLARTCRGCGTRPREPRNLSDHVGAGTRPRRPGRCTDRSSSGACGRGSGPRTRSHTGSPRRCRCGLSRG